MDYYAPEFVIPCYFVLGLVYWFLARGLISAITWQMAGRPITLLQSLTVVLIWPVSLVILLFAVGHGLFVNRKLLKHTLLGYWPVIAHGGNVLWHWRAARPKLLKALDHLKVVGLDAEARIEITMIDMHMAELEHCLVHQYGVKLKGEPTSE